MVRPIEKVDARYNGLNFPIPPRAGRHLLDFVRRQARFNGLGRIADHHSVGRNVSCHHSPGTNDCAVADRHPTQDYGRMAYPDIVTNKDVSLARRETIRSGPRLDLPQPNGVGGTPIEWMISAQKKGRRGRDTAIISDHQPRRLITFEGHHVGGSITPTPYRHSPSPLQLRKSGEARTDSLINLSGANLFVIHRAPTLFMMRARPYQINHTQDKASEAKYTTTNT